MSIKNPNIKHFIRKKRYICTGASTPTPSKSVHKYSKVTCKNCLHMLEVE